MVVQGRVSPQHRAIPGCSAIDPRHDRETGARPSLGTRQGGARPGTRTRQGGRPAQSRYRSRQGSGTSSAGVESVGHQPDARRVPRQLRADHRRAGCRRSEYDVGGGKLSGPLAQPRNPKGSAAAGPPRTCLGLGESVFGARSAPKRGEAALACSRSPARGVEDIL